MEGCPKNVMISFEMKEPGPFENGFEKPLKDYIQEFYHERGDTYSQEIQQITSLRKAISSVTRDNQGCRLLRKYYAQLQFLQSRFPMCEGGAAATSFAWYDSYSGDPFVLKDIRFEQACVLYNLGGLYSQLGANENRLTEESMKIACTYFQCAAGAFQYLKENFSHDDHLPGMNQDILSMKVTIMLGQALEAMLEKGIRDDKKASLIARISMQVYDYYQEVLNLLRGSGSSDLGSSTKKAWTSILKVKCCLHYAISYIYMSNESHSLEKFGEKVTYLKAAMDKMNECMKISKNQPDEVVQTVQFVMDVVGNKYENAKKENDFVYHMSAPDLDKLPSIQGVSPVKAILFQYDDPAVAGPDIFQKLIPMKAHESASLYSEEKAKLLRQIGSEIEAKDIHLSQSLAAMNIEHLMDPKDDTLPDELVQKNKFLKDNPDLLSKVNKMIEDVRLLSSEMDSIILDSTATLKMCEPRDADEQKEDSDKLGALKEDLKKCKDVHMQASHTNTELFKHVEDSKDMIVLLSGDQQAILRSLPSQNVVEDTSQEPVVQRIREILSKVEQMKAQRVSLHQKLRDQLSKDDVTGKLVVRETGNQQDFFQQELRKHDEIIGYIKQNLTAQDNVLQALTEANAKYASIRQRAAEIAAIFDANAKSYCAQVNFFIHLKGRISEGLTFSQQLRDSLSVVKTGINEFHDQVKKKRESKKTPPTEPPARPTAAKPKLHTTGPSNAALSNIAPAGQFTTPPAPGPGYQPGFTLGPNFPPSTRPVPLNPSSLEPGSCRPPGSVFSLQDNRPTMQIAATVSRFPIGASDPRLQYGASPRLPAEALPEVNPIPTPTGTSQLPPQVNMGRFPYMPQEPQLSLPPQTPSSMSVLSARPPVHGPFQHPQDAVLASRFQHPSEGYGGPAASGTPYLQSVGAASPQQHLVPGFGGQASGRMTSASLASDPRKPLLPPAIEYQLGPRFDSQFAPPLPSNVAYRLPDAARLPGMQPPPSEPVRSLFQQPLKPNVHPPLAPAAPQPQPNWCTPQFDPRSLQSGTRLHATAGGMQTSLGEQPRMIFSNQPGVGQHVLVQQPQPYSPSVTSNSWPHQHQPAIIRPLPAPQGYLERQPGLPHATWSGVPSSRPPTEEVQYGPSSMRLPPPLIPEKVDASSGFMPTVAVGNIAKQSVPSNVAPVEQSFIGQIVQPPQQSQQPYLNATLPPSYPAAGVAQPPPRPIARPPEQTVLSQPVEILKEPWNALGSRVSVGHGAPNSARGNLADTSNLNIEYRDIQPTPNLSAFSSGANQQQVTVNVLPYEQSFQQIRAPVQQQAPLQPWQQLQPGWQPQPRLQQPQPRLLQQQPQSRQLPSPDDTNGSTFALVGSSHMIGGINETLSTAPPLLPRMVYNNAGHGQRADLQALVSGSFDVVSRPYDNPSIAATSLDGPAYFSSGLPLQALVSSPSPVTPLVSSRPVMSHRHDPVVSGILQQHIPASTPFAEISQLNFQIQMQQLIMQQQQMMAFMQTQQSRQHTEEVEMIHKLEAQLLEQQKRFDELLRGREKQSQGEVRAEDANIEEHHQKIAKQQKLLMELLRKQDEENKLMQEEQRRHVACLEKVQPLEALKNVDGIAVRTNNNSSGIAHESVVVKGDAAAESRAFSDVILAGNIPDYPSMGAKKLLPQSLVSTSAQSCQSSVVASAEPENLKSFVLTGLGLSSCLDRVRDEGATETHGLTMAERDGYSSLPEINSRPIDSDTVGESTLGSPEPDLVDWSGTLDDRPPELKTKLLLSGTSPEINFNESPTPKEAVVDFGTNSSKVESVEFSAPFYEPKLDEFAPSCLSKPADEASAVSAFGIANAVHGSTLDVVSHASGNSRCALVSQKSSAATLSCDAVVSDADPPGSVAEPAVAFALVSGMQVKGTGDSSVASIVEAKVKPEPPEAANALPGKADAIFAVAGRKSASRISPDSSRKDEIPGTEGIMTGSSSAAVAKTASISHDTSQAPPAGTPKSSAPANALTPTLSPATSRIIRGALRKISSDSPTRRLATSNSFDSLSKKDEPNSAISITRPRQTPEVHLDDTVDMSPPYARQLGHMSFYVGCDDEISWRKYIAELEIATKKLHNNCVSFANFEGSGFSMIWNNLAKLEELDSSAYTSDIGLRNFSKNRYRDIVPWDHTRVKLKSAENDYINASKIKHLTPFSPNYIATQGPIPQCFADFWTMIWECKAKVIVMLTNEVEGNRLKCHPYWPRNRDDPVAFGNVIVILVEEAENAAWKTRKFTLLNKKTDDTRVVDQLQFTSWPDYGTPDTPAELVAFMDEVYKIHQYNDPMFNFPVVLHCSAGVGRTGSFCCIYSAIQEIKNQNGLIEIPGVVRKLRQCRAHMVQRKEQLIFIYQAILYFAERFIHAEHEKLEMIARPVDKVHDETFHVSSNQNGSDSSSIPVGNTGIDSSRMNEVDVIKVEAAASTDVNAEAAKIDKVLITSSLSDADGSLAVCQDEDKPRSYSAAVGDELLSTLDNLGKGELQTGFCTSTGESKPCGENELPHVTRKTETEQQVLLGVDRSSSHGTKDVSIMAKGTESCDSSGDNELMLPRVASVSQFSVDPKDTIVVQSLSDLIGKVEAKDGESQSGVRDFDERRHEAPSKFKISADVFVAPASPLLAAAPCAVAPDAHSVAASDAKPGGSDYQS